jgi:5-methylcytosine-specific restriction endonuclease McrA
MKPRTATAIVVLAAVAWFVAGHTDGQGPAPVVIPDPASTDPVTGGANAFLSWAQGALGQLAHAVAWSVDHPWLIGVLVGVLVLTAVVRLVRAHRPVTKDPQRAYTSEQRTESFSLAGGQCEYTSSFLLFRCRRPAEHADHLFPWSRGGATSLANCVAACQHCNLSKGAKLLPAWRKRLLVRRRRRYYPAGVDTACGQKYTERFASGEAEIAPSRATRRAAT